VGFKGETARAKGMPVEDNLTLAKMGVEKRGQGGEKTKNPNHTGYQPCNLINRYGNAWWSQCKKGGPRTMWAFKVSLK